MQFSRWEKIALGLVGSVLLGGIGSGVWELALKPLGQWCGRLALTGATLGSNSVRDSIYREAAKGYHEASALNMFSLTVFVMFAICSFALGVANGKRRASKDKHVLASEIAMLEPEEKASFLEKKIKLLRRKLYISELVVIGFGVLLASIQLVDLLKLEQANAAYTYFAQSMAICRPYIGDQQAQVMQSRFAAINGRNDYLKLADDLKQIATANQRNLPEFNPW